MKLTPEQLKQFDTEGWVLLPNLFMRDVLVCLADCIDQLRMVKGPVLGVKVHQQAPPAGKAFLDILAPRLLPPSDA